MRVREKMMLEVMSIKQVSRKVLAAHLGISKSHFCNVLKGRRRFNLRHTKRLIEFFGADLMAKAINWEGLNVSNPL